MDCNSIYSSLPWHNLERDDFSHKCFVSKLHTLVKLYSACQVSVKIPDIFLNTVYTIKSNYLENISSTDSLVDVDIYCCIWLRKIVHLTQTNLVFMQVWWLCFVKMYIKYFAQITIGNLVYRVQGYYAFRTPRIMCMRGHYWNTLEMLVHEELSGYPRSETKRHYYSKALYSTRNAMN